MVTLCLLAAHASGVGAAESVVFSLQTKLTPTDPSVDFFGAAVAVDGDTAVVGVPSDRAGQCCEVGSASVYVRTGTTWSLQSRLLAPDGANFDRFASAVAIHGDTMLVGSPFDRDEGFVSGSVYVFVRSGTSWAFQAKLLADDVPLTFGRTFGGALAIRGDTAVIGAANDQVNGLQSGSAYVFTRSGSLWTKQAKLLAPDGVQADQFGGAVALSGETALVGARHFVNDVANAPGSAYVFVRSGTAWAQQAKLTAADGRAGNEFGFSVALAGDSAIVGAPFDDAHGKDSGSAYVFTRVANAWSEQAKLTAADGAQGDWLGFSVSLRGDTAVVGAPKDQGTLSARGSARVYLRSGRAWAAQTTLSTGAASSFGFSLSATPEILVVGDPNEAGARTDSGAVYVYGLAPNGVPVARKDAYRVEAADGLTVPAPGVLTNDTDPDGDPLTAVLVRAPAHGDLALHADGSFTYRPEPGFTGKDRFTYRAADTSSLSRKAKVTLNVVAKPVAG